MPFQIRSAPDTDQKTFDYISYRTYTDLVPKTFKIW